MQPLRSRQRLVLLVCLGIALTAIPLHAGNGIGFQPVNPAELNMTSEPAAPGAQAIILYRQVDRDDNGSGHQDVYYRIKILTDEGRQYADIEIPFVKEVFAINDLHARSIAPDGTIANYDGKPLEKTIVKAKGLRYLAKVLTLPNVQKGGIVEYYYRISFRLESALFDSHWILSDELFTKEARFSLKTYNPPYGKIGVHWSWRGLPPGADAPAQGSDKIIRLDVKNIPAFATEDYMPPENELKSRVDFIYSPADIAQDKNSFWTEVDKATYEWLNGFLGKRGALQSVVAQIVLPSDDSETKLRKIYAKVQQLRNTSYEEEATEQEEKRQKQKADKNVGDVWKHGGGDREDLTWLYLALVRDAGFEVYPVLASNREDYFFDVSQMDYHRLDVALALINFNGKDIYCDPGAAFVPFGFLPWYETGVVGLRLDKDGGSWIKTPVPDSATSQIIRKADLKADSEGNVEGKLTLTYTGLEALAKRTDQRHEDDQQRKKYLEDIVKSYISAGSEVELVNHPDWTSSSPELTAEFKVKVPGWMTPAGKRILLPVGLFSSSEKGVFEHAERVHPIYYEFPFQKVDNLTITLPEGLTVTNLPPSKKRSGGAVSYELTAENKDNVLHISRVLRMDVLIVGVDQYPALRGFYQFVRTGDDTQVMLQSQVAAASK